jgi:site-specific DNA-methyltransferase (adenine-specific)
MTEDFMASTLDVWAVPPESAQRVGHPAPFPVELPEQLIRLYTFKDDLILDPFMGSGSSLVAAARLGRRYVGYDLDATYIEIARKRVETEMNSSPHESLATIEEGKPAQKLAEELLEEAGFTITTRNTRIRKTGVTINFVATDSQGATWWFDVAGAFTTYRGGLLRSDMVWKTLGRASALKKARGDTPLVVMTTHLPKQPSEGDSALRAAGPDALFDIIDMLSPDSLDRLQSYAKGGLTTSPQSGFWTE